MKKSRKLTKDEIDYLLSINKDDVDMRLLKRIFADTKNTNRNFNTYDKFTLSKDQYYNSKTILTTAGRYIVNLVLIPESYLKKHGYVNTELSKKEIGKIEQKMSDMIINDEMPIAEYSKYLDVGQWLGFGTAYFINPSMSYNINQPIKEVMEKRDELFEKYIDRLEKGDIGIASAIEKELLDMAKDKLIEQGEDSYDYFASGVGKYSNNFKKTSVMGGALENPGTGEFTITKSNYFEGMSKEELPHFNNLTIQGGYGRGVETQNTGYETKKITNAMQTTILGEDKSDCGTNYTIEVTMTDSLVDMFRLRYAVFGNTVKLLDSEDLRKMVGKKIKFRSPLFCKDEHICNICAGELHKKIGIKNVGLVSQAIGGTMSNLAMSKFHNASVSVGELNLDNYIKLK
jgi:hypothetical protein